MKKIITLLLLAVSLVSGSVVSAEAEYELVFSELNPEYVKYLEQQEQISLLSENDSESSYIPAPFVATDSLYALNNIDESLPSSYDARDDGRITPVGNQGKDGVCWAFAGNSSLEAYFMPEREFDFSEQHVRFALSADNGNEWGYDRRPHEGGNFRIYATYLMRWSGPVWESDDPYDLSTESREVSLTNRFEEQFHVQGFAELPNPERYVEDVTDEQRRAHVNLVKQYVMKYGSVFTSIYYNINYLNVSTNSYYYNEKNSAGGTRYAYSNHALSIVGWDDEYSKENFKTKPSEDGAFLIKNSWGTNFGDNGYFYLSYEDVYAGWNAGVITRVDQKDNFDHIYQHDVFCLTGAFGFSSVLTGKIISEACYGNIFTTGSEEEALKAVSVYITAPDTTCSVYLNTENGQLKHFSQMQKVATEFFETPGYYTIDLPQEYALTGEQFAVAVHVKSAQKEQDMIPLEAKLVGGDITNSYCSSNAGESYYSFDSKVWYDTAELTEGNGENLEANVMIKAYTVDLPVETTVRFSDSKGQSVSGWNHGDAVKAETYYYNDQEDTVSTKIYLALYQGQQLVSVISSEEVKVQPGKSVHLITDAITIPEQGEYQLKQMIWDAETLLPLTLTKELPKEPE